MFPDWHEQLKATLADCQSALDLGCGPNSPIQYCAVAHTVGVDAHQAYLAQARAKGTHSDYIMANIASLQFAPASFDAVVATEVLEHFNKQDGFALLEQMARWARKTVIISTPNGFLWQDGYDDNPFQEHKSGWSADELRRLGFDVYGIGGWRRLSGYKGHCRLPVPYLSGLVVDVSQKMVFRHPEHAFQLFAVKQLQRGK